MKWSDITQKLNSWMKSHGLKWLVSFLAKAAGITGGFWIWLIGLAAKFGWKKADKEIQSAARIEDRRVEDVVREETYKKHKKEKASEEQLIKDELDILNSGRR